MKYKDSPISLWLYTATQFSLVMLLGLHDEITMKLQLESYNCKTWPIKPKEGNKSVFEY